MKTSTNKINKEEIVLKSEAILFFLNKIYPLLKEVIFIFSFTLLTAIGSKFRLEIGTVPITMQTLPVLLSGFFLGSLRAALSQLTYMILGLAGIPWFSRGGGFNYIFSPTFGYIIGFILAAYLVGWFLERVEKKSLKKIIFAIFIGNIVLYIPGLLWLGKFVGLEKVLRIGFYPFILTDLLKLLLAISLLSIFSFQKKGRFN